MPFLSIWGQYSFSYIIMQAYKKIKRVNLTLSFVLGNIVSVSQLIIFFIYKLILYSSSQEFYKYFLLLLFVYIFYYGLEFNKLSLQRYYYGMCAWPSGCQFHVCQKCYQIYCALRIHNNTIFYSSQLIFRHEKHH